VETQSASARTAGVIVLNPVPAKNFYSTVIQTDWNAELKFSHWETKEISGCLIESQGFSSMVKLGLSNAKRIVGC
jgi:hypothetical protein